MIKVLNTVDKDTFEPLLQVLLKRKVPKSQSNRKGFAPHRSAVFGIATSRWNTTGLSVYSKRMPKIYEEILKLGEIICPFPFKSIYLNNNVVCPKHKDARNVGNSCLVSFGDYEGCNIVIEGQMYDAKYTPIIFNGAELEHWNTDDLIGNKYSLVFYN